MQIPMGYVYIILPLSGLVMMFYALCFINQSIQQLKQPAQEAS
ncbi:TPA: TRAP transporter small permease, partial [Escherichia coli]|nr:TRAP transporter small permease [Escherichia coli]HBH4824440.1 TRAP transporter small permease [Escherichia coli]